MTVNGDTPDKQRDSQREEQPADHARQQPAGVIGLGAMGAAMAARLLDRGFKVWAWNRTAAGRRSPAARSSAARQRAAREAG